MWNTETSKAIGEPFRGHTDGVDSIAYSPDGRRIISGLGDQIARVWNTVEWETLLCVDLSNDDDDDDPLC